MNQIEPDATFLDAIVHRHRGQGRHPVRLRDIYNRLAAGATNKQIRKELSGIHKKTINLARAFLIAQDGDGFRKSRHKKSASKFGILVDENLSPETVNNLYTHFTTLTHTRFVGLNGKKDPEVWRWAVNNGVDAIVTRDRRMKSREDDLTRIAIEQVVSVIQTARERGADIDISALPLVIHINAHERPHHKAAALFKKHALEILDCIRNRTTPYILVTEFGVKKGPDYEELVEKYLTTDEEKKQESCLCEATPEEKMAERCLRKLQSLRKAKGELAPDEEKYTVYVKTRILCGDQSVTAPGLP